MPAQEIENLVHILSKMPGFGQRSSRRMVLHLIKNKNYLLKPLIESLQNFSSSIKICNNCGNVDACDPCLICSHPVRSNSYQLCVVEDVADLWAIERSNIYNGLYHILGGTLSAIDGRGPNDINIEKLVTRCAKGNIKEIILATNATLEGQTTAHYIAERLKEFNISLSRIAHGIPIGGELDYMDDGTLGTALKLRRPF